MSDSEMPVFLCRAEMPEGPAEVYTLLPPEVVSKRGLASHAIIGGLTRPLTPGERVTPELFARNFLFVEFLHEFLASTAPKEPACRAEAQRIGDGWLYIIDQRTATPGDAVPPEDIIGAFQVSVGKIVPGSYRPSSKHRILTDRGFFRLSPWLYARLMEAMARPQPE